MALNEITTLMIVEVAGRPKEYLKEALEKHISQLNNIKDVKLISMKIAEAKKIDEEKDIYSCFAEVEVSVMGMQKLLDLVFDFMPSSIEIIDPADIELNCQETTMFLNDLSGRLHKYDEVAKIAQMRLHQLTEMLQKTKENQPTPPAQNSPIQPIQLTYGEKKQEIKKVDAVVKKSTKKKK